MAREWHDALGLLYRTGGRSGAMGHKPHTEVGARKRVRKAPQKLDGQALATERMWGRGSIMIFQR